MSAAPTNPKEKKPASAPTNQPRRAAGTNSDRKGAITTLSAPAPAPASTRAVRKTQKFGDSAATAEKKA